MHPRLQACPSRFARTGQNRVARGETSRETRRPDTRNQAFVKDIKHDQRSVPEYDRLKLLLMTGKSGTMLPSTVLLSAGQFCSSLPYTPFVAVYPSRIAERRCESARNGHLHRSIRRHLDNIGWLESQFLFPINRSASGPDNLAALAHKHVINGSAILQNQLHMRRTRRRFAKLAGLG